jgi:hypothetical protein
MARKDGKFLPAAFDNLDVGDVGQSFDPEEICCFPRARCQLEGLQDGYGKKKYLSGIF